MLLALITITSPFIMDMFNVTMNSDSQLQL